MHRFLLPLSPPLTITSPKKGGLGRNFFLLAAMTLAACTDAYNWRNLTALNRQVQFVLPCKPDLRENALPLLSNAQALQVTMQGCETKGSTFAVAYAVVPKGESAQDALSRWESAYAASGAQAAGLKIKGLQQGHTVAIASLLGPKLPKAAQDMFFDHFQLPKY